MVKNSKEVESFAKSIELSAEEMATAVSKISRGMDALNVSRLKRKTLLILISHAAGVPQRTVESVLESLLSLEKTYLK